MEWAEDNGGDYIFGLAGNATLDALAAETADNLRFHHAKSSQTKLRTFASFTYQAGSWKRPRKVVVRLECSLQPVDGETGMRQEVDIRYVVTSLKGSAQHLYENVYCRRGQMENLIKLHKAQLASDRMSCHSATANQVRLGLHTAAFWLMHGVRAAIPLTSPLASAEFATIRDRLIKIGARVIEHIARIRIQLPTSWRGRCSEPSRSASCRPAREPRGQAPRRAADTGRSTPHALHSESSHTDPLSRIASARLLNRPQKTRQARDPGLVGAGSKGWPGKSTPSREKHGRRYC